MEEYGELTFSQEALFSRASFFDGLNDVNLFVEDAESQYFYETIFKRLLGEHYTIQTIFPCGGKPGVKEMFRERGAYTEGIKNIYVVDGDFDRIIFPDQMIINPHFVYLEMYNIESCIINETGVHNLAKSHLKCMDAEVYDRVKYKEWWTRIIDESKDLFFCYCFIQKCGLSIPNVDRSHYDFLDSKTGFMRRDGTFESYLKELFTNYPDAESEIEKIRIDFEKLFGTQYEKLICGKFLISSLHDYLYTIIHKSIQKDDIIWALANSFDKSKLRNVKEACIGVN